MVSFLFCVGGGAPCCILVLLCMCWYGIVLQFLFVHVRLRVGRVCVLYVLLSSFLVCVNGPLCVVCVVVGVACCVSSMCMYVILC